MLNHRKHSLRLNEAPFTLECSATLPHVQIAYDTYGELNEEKSNVVIVLHALTGWPAAHEWWSGLIGAGRLLDTEKYFIISPNFLGSCNGSTGPESIDPHSGIPYHASFPEITIRDIAKANLQLLDAIGIDEVALAIGGSMGGMVLLEMAAQQPERFRAIVPIAVSDAHSAWRIAFSSVIRKTIIAHDPSLSDSQKLVEGMKLARQIATTTYRCSDEFDSRFGREQIGTKFEVENYLEHQGEKIADHFSPYSYLTLTRAMELYVLCQCGISFSFCQAERSNMAEAKAYATPPCPVHSRLIQCPALFIGISSDILYSSREIESFAALFPQGEYRTLVAGHGHDSFLVDAEALAKLVQPFFLSAEINHSQLQSVL